jgi:putative transcriptional regulator
MSRVGKLLVAHPNFPENSPFCKTVIYIYDDNEVSGTLGFVLNRPTVSLTDLCEDNGIMFPDTEPRLHLGGPVQTSALSILHSDDWCSTNTGFAGKRLFVSSDNLMLNKIAAGNEPLYWRAFAGRSTWVPGQLDAEIAGSRPYAKNTWILADADEDVLFNYNGDDQWIKAVDLCSQQTINHFF